MKDKTAVQLLKTPEEKPTATQLQTILTKSLYKLPGDMSQLFADHSLTMEWRFYKDGNAWLGKVTHKRKTVLWLSVWDQFIKTSFYFTEKTRQGINDLAINAGVKKSFSHAKPIGKLIPLIINLATPRQLNKLQQVIKYKLVNS
ncbi:DUF3788 family protein [Gynurincola endophyticus]|uniref:DUF3788 family protein n=1 Tax=Gynurincola endophyticus TaxID=2479004 RepID=UPI000F8DA061|nr:DUF3788 family protein [Gynurincola endophyticus]